MQKFVAAALRARSGGRIIRLRSPGKTEDQPGFQGRQQVLIEFPASGSTDQSPRIPGQRYYRCRPPGSRVAWFQRETGGAGQPATPPHSRSPPGIRWQPGSKSTVFPQGRSGSGSSRRVGSKTGSQRRDCLRFCAPAARPAVWPPQEGSGRYGRAVVRCLSGLRGFKGILCSGWPVFLITSQLIDNR